MAALTPAATLQQVAILPDPILPALSRPLSVVGDRTYAAIWAYVNHPDKGAKGAGRRHHGAPTASLSRELLLVRDDGRLLFGRPDSPGAQSQPPAQPAAYITDCFLPRRPPVPTDRLWSGTGVQRYLDGHRPDPADVFRRLVAVINQFVDFTGSLGPPSLMAEFFATYVLTTWFSPAFPFLGLLWLTGDNGSGKSRLLALLARLAHLGLYLPVPPPPAALRSLASLGASLAIDDADFLGQRPNSTHWSISNRNALLLAGRQRGALLPITLAEPGSAPGASNGKTRFPQRYTRQLDVSGPRIFASVHPPHPSIARYFIVVPLLRTSLAPLAAADPADPAAWPPGLTQADLIDDLWALSLSRLRDLPPHLPLAAQAADSSSDTVPHLSVRISPPTSHLSPPRLPLAAQAASSDIRPATSSASHLPLLGSSLQPWHALLATASWLSSQPLTAPTSDPPSALLTSHLPPPTSDPQLPAPLTRDFQRLRLLTSSPASSPSPTPTTPIVPLPRPPISPPWPCAGCLSALPVFTMCCS